MLVCSMLELFKCVKLNHHSMHSACPTQDPEAERVVSMFELEVPEEKWENEIFLSLARPTDIASLVKTNWKQE